MRSLKLVLGKREDYQKVIEHYRSTSKLWSDPQKYMTVVPVNFAKEHYALFLCFLDNIFSYLQSNTNACYL